MFSVFIKYRNFNDMVLHEEMVFEEYQAAVDWAEKFIKQGLTPREVHIFQLRCVLRSSLSISKVETFKSKESLDLGTTDDEWE